MGLLDDINNDILEAYDSDLLDATREVQFHVITNSVYDPDTMKNTDTETLKTVRVVKVSDHEGEYLDEPSTKDTAKYLVMEYDRISSNITFKKDMKITDIYDQYKIIGIDTDPAKASYTLNCRVWG